MILRGGRTRIVEMLKKNFKIKNGTPLNLSNDMDIKEPSVPHLTSNVQWRLVELFNLDHVWN